MCIGRVCVRKTHNAFMGLDGGGGRSVWQIHSAGNAADWVYLSSACPVGQCQGENSYALQ